MNKTHSKARRQENHTPAMPAQNAAPSRPEKPLIPLTPSALILIVLVIISSALSFYKIDAESFWGDEQNSVRIARMEIKEIIKGQDAAHPPGYHLILHGWIGLFGPSDTSTRGFSAFFAAASVVAIFFLGRELFNTKTGLVASALMACSHYFVYYGQEARPYTLTVFLTAISTYLLLRIARRPRFGTEAFSYIMCAVLGFYAHYFFLFVLAIQFSYLLFRLVFYAKESLIDRALFFVQVSAPTGLLVGFWLFYKFIPRFVTNNPTTGIIGWISTPTPASWGRLFREYGGLGRVDSTLFWIAAITVLALFLAPRAISIVRKKPFGFESFIPELYTLGSLLAPLIAAYIVSQRSPIWVSRYLIIVLPFFFLIIARAIDNTRYRALAVACIALLAIPNAALLQNMYSTQEKEDWRSATQYIEENYRGGDIIILYSLPGFLTLHYKPPQTSWEQAGTSVLNAQTQDKLRKGLETSIGGRYRFFVIYTTYLYPPDADRSAVLDSQVRAIDPQFKRVARQTFTRILIDTYEKPIIADGVAIDPLSVQLISLSSFRGKFGDPYQGILPFYSRGSTAVADIPISNGGYYLLYEARGDDPPPIAFTQSIDGTAMVINLTGNITQWTPFSSAFNVRRETVNLRFTLTEDVYIAKDGKAIADNALYLRNLRIVKVSEDDSP